MPVEKNRHISNIWEYVIRQTIKSKLHSIEEYPWYNVWDELRRNALDGPRMMSTNGLNVLAS
jgi:hypothetical protein